MRVAHPGIVACCAALLALPAAGDTRGAAEEPAKPTSLLLITLDTTRADRLGCYGAEDAQTPNLDRLAAGGTRFERALSPTPLTLPSHATLMSGRVPRRHGVRNNALYRLDGDVPLLAESLRAAGYRTAAFVSAAVLDRITGIGRGFGLYDDRVRVGDRAAFNYQERAASQTTDAVLAALPALEPPFFLWVHYFDPHLPFVPPEPFRSRFADRPYDGEIAFMDAETGRLLDAVRARAGRVLVAVAGDHGESFGEHDEDAHGVFVYQATQRVPLILHGPGVPAGRTVGSNVGLVDVAPTLLRLLGRPELPDTDGRSLVGLLREARPAPTDYELESFFPRFAYGWAPLRALVRGDHKYIDAPTPELYDLAADPNETRNRAATDAKVARALADELARRVGDDDPAATEIDPQLAAQRERLRSLGYVGGSGAAGADEIDPKDAIGWVRELDAARRELQLGDAAKAAAPLGALLEKNSDNLPALLTLVQVRLSTGDAPAAVATARRALRLAPDDDLVHFNLANALSVLERGTEERGDEARVHYERALELNPRHADAYLNYAALLVSRSSADAALSLLRRARGAGVEDPDVELEIGVLELERGRIGPARDAFERSLALNPCAEGIHEALGRLAQKDGRFAEAAARYERALECRPTLATAAALGSLYRDRLADPGRAARAYRRALALLPPGDPRAAELRRAIESLER
jgi:arylsulfatase A-like enzyme/Tfp pilus assembly protein PilF